MVFISALLLIISFFAWRISSRVAWLTGAMETHSTMMLRIEAKRGIKEKPIKLIWWDPSIEPFPFSGEHNTEAELSEIYLGIPPKHRRANQNWCGKFKLWRLGTTTK
jgi:hypothetical protein